MRTQSRMETQTVARDHLSRRALRNPRAPLTAIFSAVTSARVHLRTIFASPHRGASRLSRAIQEIIRSVTTMEKEMRMGKKNCM